MNRGDLMDAFGVSVNQASTDLNCYIAIAPDNMIYDKSARACVRGSGFDPMFLKPDASRYYSQLRSVADGILDQSDARIGQFPSCDVVPTPVRRVSVESLRSVVAAIWRSEAIEIKHQSLSRPEPRWRWIAPHSIGFDGFRCHTRAFCLSDRIFIDFLLSRIIETRTILPSEVRSEADTDWNEQVPLEFGPHPELSDTQQKFIALDCGMRDGKAKIPVRESLLYYVLKRLRLDTDPAARRAQDQEIVLLNAAEINSRTPTPDSASRMDG